MTNNTFLLVYFHFVVGTVWKSMLPMIAPLKFGSLCSHVMIYKFKPAEFHEALYSRDKIFSLSQNCFVKMGTSYKKIELSLPHVLKCLSIFTF